MSWVGRTWDDLVVYANRKDKMKTHSFHWCYHNLYGSYSRYSWSHKKVISVLWGILVVFNVRCAFKVSGGNVFLFEWFYACKHVQTLHLKLISLCQATLDVVMNLQFHLIEKLWQTFWYSTAPSSDGATTIPNRCCSHGNLHRFPVMENLKMSSNVLNGDLSGLEKSWK